MAFDLKTQLAIGKKYEAIIDNHLTRSGYVPKCVPPAWQRMGVDRLLYSGHVCVSAEYKADVRAGQTGNLFVETYIQGTGGKLSRGWALKSAAQLLLVLVPASRTLLWCKMFDVKLHLESWRSTFPFRWVDNRTPDGRTFRGQGVLVPVNDFIDACCYQVEVIDDGKSNLRRLA